MRRFSEQELNRYRRQAAVQRHLNAAGLILTGVVSWSVIILVVLFFAFNVRIGGSFDDGRSYQDWEMVDGDQSWREVQTLGENDYGSWD